MSAPLPAQDQSGQPAVSRPVPVIVDLRGAVETAMPRQTQSMAQAKRISDLLVASTRLRKAHGTKALRLTLVNEACRLTGQPQAVILMRAMAGGPWKIAEISSIAAADRTAPLVHWLEAALQPGDVLVSPLRFEIETTSAPDGDYPFDQVFMVPLCDRGGRCFGTLALLGEAPLATENESSLALLAETGAHAWTAFAANRLGAALLVTRKRLLLVAAMLAAALFIPVPMTVLAPAEIIARDPVVVAAPIQGVIETVHVAPDQPVATGDLLFSYQATDLFNRNEIALKTVETKLSRLRTVEQEALRSLEGARNLAEARAEHELARAEAHYTAQSLALSKVYAQQDGIAVFSSREEWTGKPVQTGERVLRIANPQQWQLRFDMAVSDSIIISTGLTARVFLDADPLNPLRALITARSYQAVQSPSGQMVYELIAQASGHDGKTGRIGLRGTAQIFGAPVPLGFFLFRKPLSALRQQFGL